MAGDLLGMDSILIHTRKAPRIYALPESEIIDTKSESLTQRPETIIFPKTEPRPKQPEPKISSKPITTKIQP